MPLTRFFALVFLCLPCLASGAVKPYQEPLVNLDTIYSRAAPFLAMQHHASIYLGTLSNHVPEIVPNSRGTFERVTVEVTDTLYGPKITRLSLLAVTASGDMLGDMGSSVWPKPDSLPPGTKLLLVVLPGPLPDMPGEELATNFVVPISGPDDPQVKAWKLIAELHQTKGPALVEALRKAPVFQNASLARYVGDATMMQLKVPDAVSVFLAQMDAAIALPADSATAGMSAGILLSLQENKVAPPEMRRDLIRLLARATAAPHARVRDGAASALSQAVRRLRYFGPDGAVGNFLSETERSEIQKNVRKEAGEPAFWNWLAGKPVTSAFPENTPDLDDTTLVRRHASVYVATVAQVPPANGPGNTIESIRLNVHETILGTKAQTLTLPDDRKGLDNFSPRGPVWSGLEYVKPDAKILVVVLPGPFFPGDWPAAATYYGMLDSDRSLAARWRTLARFLDTPHPDLKKALLDATQAAPPIPAFFLADTATARLAPPDALDVLTALLARQKDQSLPEIRNALICLDSLLGPPPAVLPKELAAAFRAARPLLGGNDTVEYEALKWMASRTEPFPAAQVFTIEERASLRTALSLVTQNSPNQLPRAQTLTTTLRQWLGEH